MVAVLQEEIVPIFGIWDPATGKFTTFDVLQLQCAGHFKSLTRHIRCTESLRPSILWFHRWLWLCMRKSPEFSKFEILLHMCSPPWILSHYSQPGIVGPLLDLFNVTNLVVQSFLCSNYSLRRCRCKQPQFSEFEIMDHMCSIPCIPSHYSQSGISNRSLHQLNALNRLVASVSQSHSWL